MTIDFFTEALNRPLWRLKTSRPTVFVKIHDCENKEKRTLVQIPTIFFKDLVRAAKKAERWKETDAYTESKSHLDRVRDFSYYSPRTNKVDDTCSESEFQGIHDSKLTQVSHTFPNP